jgi:hypothetical protein
VLPPADGHEWLSLSADDGSTWLVDVTFLSSGYGCIYGRGCPGIDHGAASHGCCNHGAHFSDGADRRTTARYADRLRPDEWQHWRRAQAKGGPFKRAPGDGWMTRLVDGACIFLNRADHPGGPGCALHQAALARGERPMDWKPDVCWQLPLRLQEHTDEHGHVTSTLREWKRRDWGEGGHEFHWWCTDSPDAFVGDDLVYVTMRDEIVEMIGRPVYELLARQLKERGRRAALPHPAVRR